MRLVFGIWSAGLVEGDVREKNKFVRAVLNFLVMGKTNGFYVFGFATSGEASIVDRELGHDLLVVGRPLCLRDGLDPLLLGLESYWWSPG